MLQNLHAAVGQDSTQELCATLVAVDGAYCTAPTRQHGARSYKSYRSYIWGIKSALEDLDDEVGTDSLVRCVKGVSCSVCLRLRFTVSRLLHHVFWILDIFYGYWTLDILFTSFYYCRTAVPPRFGNKLLGIWVLCAPNATAVWPF